MARPPCSDSDNATNQAREALQGIRGKTTPSTKPEKKGLWQGILAPLKNKKDSVRGNLQMEIEMEDFSERRKETIAMHRRKGRANGDGNLTIQETKRDSDTAYFPPSAEDGNSLDKALLEFLALALSGPDIVDERFDSGYLSRKVSGCPPASASSGLGDTTRVPRTIIEEPQVRKSVAALTQKLLPPISTPQPPHPSTSNIHGNRKQLTENLHYPAQTVPRRRVPLDFQEQRKHEQTRAWWTVEKVNAQEKNK